MIIDEALKDLQDRIDGEFNIKGKDDCADMKLGIEALKAYQQARQEGQLSAKELLPGETEK